MKAPTVNSLFRCGLDLEGNVEGNRDTCGVSSRAGLGDRFAGLGNRFIGSYNFNNKSSPGIVFRFK